MWVEPPEVLERRVKHERREQCLKIPATSYLTRRPDGLRRRRCWEYRPHCFSSGSPARQARPGVWKETEKESRVDENKSA